MSMDTDSDKLMIRLVELGLMEVYKPDRRERRRMGATKDETCYRMTPAGRQSWDETGCNPVCNPKWFTPD